MSKCHCSRCDCQIEDLNDNDYFVCSFCQAGYHTNKISIEKSLDVKYKK